MNRELVFVYINGAVAFWMGWLTMLIIQAGARAVRRNRAVFPSQIEVKLVFPTDGVHKLPPMNIQFNGGTAYGRELTVAYVSPKLEAKSATPGGKVEFN